MTRPAVVARRQQPLAPHIRRERRARIALTDVDVRLAVAIVLTATLESPAICQTHPWKPIRVGLLVFLRRLKLRQSSP